MEQPGPMSRPRASERWTLRRGFAFAALLWIPLSCGEGAGSGGGAAASREAVPGESVAGGAADEPATMAVPARPGGPGEWALYGRDPAQTRFSSLDQITRENVSELERAWSYATEAPEVFEATPVVVGDAMYVSTPLSGGTQRVVKLDAATGERVWETELETGEVRPGPTVANRGVAFHRERVYVGTLDARLVAIDAGSGEVAWEVRTADAADGYAHKQAPLAYGGVVYTGIAGGQLGIRGQVKAFDADTGEEIWTWHSIPSPEEGGWWGEWRDSLPGAGRPLGRDIAAERADSGRYVDSWRRGGGAVWTTPSLDPELGLLFVGTGNPAPELTDATRPGDNRWTVSVCAIRIEDGSTEWCYQYLPHDVWGMDAASPPFLYPHATGEDTLPAVGHFSKLGWFYAWDRRTGELLTLSENYVPHRNFLEPPTREGVEMAPGIYGGTEWSPGGFSPHTGLAYSANLHMPGRYFVRAEGPRAGTTGFEPGPVGERWGNVVALDPVSGEIVWEARTDRPMVGGVLVTAGGLVFAGRLSGGLEARDAETGEMLWRGETAHPCASAPMTYTVGGMQHVAVSCGGHFLGGDERGDAVEVFALSGPGP